MRSSFNARASDDLKNIYALGDKKQWQSVARLAQNELRNPLLHLQVRRTLDSIHKQAVELEALEGVRAALDGGDASLRNIDIKVLPESVQHSVKGLNSAEELQSAINTKWTKPPDAAALKQHVANFQTATEDAVLARRLQQHLAHKAAWEGHQEAARSLLPNDAALDRNTLRDLKTLVTGEANVSATAAGQKSARPDVVSKAQPENPTLIPEADAKGIKPRIQEPPRAGLPPLQSEIASTRQKIRTRLKTDVDQRIETHMHSFHYHLDLLRRADPDKKEQEKEKKAKEEKKLNPPKVSP